METNGNENREVILSVQCAWGKEEIFLNHTENGSFISNTSNDFSIKDCPSSVDDLDEGLVISAFYCHYDTYKKIGVKQFTYENLWDEIIDAYRVFYNK